MPTSVPNFNLLALLVSEIKRESQNLIWRLLALCRTPFWGPFNAKPIIERALRKSDINGATKLKLYRYNGIGNYLGVSIFFARGASGVVWPPNVNLGP